MRLRRFITAALSVVLLLGPVLVPTSAGADSVPASYEFPVDSTQGLPLSLTQGPDGNLWFTEPKANRIGQISRLGVVREFPLPEAGAEPVGITAGPDGDLWFTESTANAIGRISPDGIVKEFPLPVPNSEPQGITLGPDGNLWFTEEGSDRIGRITPDGVLSEFSLPTPGSSPLLITTGPDGNLWFTETDGNRIGRITPYGRITEFPIPTPHSKPIGICTGPDGNLWFAESAGNNIGRITPAGKITEFPLPTTGATPWFTAPGPGGVYFTEALANAIGFINPKGKITEDPLPVALAVPGGLTMGPDNELWFTEANIGAIGRLAVTGLDVSTGDDLFTVTIPAGTLPPTAYLTVTESPVPGDLPAGERSLDPVFRVSSSVYEFEQPAEIRFPISSLNGLSPERVSVFARTANSPWRFRPTTVDAASETATFDLQGPEDLAVLTNDEQFSDVPADYWARPDIDRLLGEGIVNGFPDGTFHPNAPLTRAAFVKMLVLALNLPLGSGATAFADVPPTAWYATYVASAANAGLIQGVSPEDFAPNATLTREEMAVLIARALGLRATSPSPVFTDERALDPWAKPGVTAAVQAGYLDGFPDGSFRPLNPTTRAQAAKVIALITERLAP